MTEIEASLRNNASIYFSYMVQYQVVLRTHLNSKIDGEGNALERGDRRELASDA